MLWCGQSEENKKPANRAGRLPGGSGEHATKRYNGLQEDGASFSQKGQAYCSEEAQAYCCGERQAYCSEEDDAALSEKRHAHFSEENQADFRRRNAVADCRAAGGIARGP